MSQELTALIHATQQLTADWHNHMSELQACGQVDTTEWDWPPVLVLDDGSDKPVQQKTIIIEQFMNAPHGKTMLFQQIVPKLIADHDIKRVVFCATAWAAKVQTDEDGSFDQSRPVSQHPDREEIVFLIAVDSDDVVGYQAKVTRRLDCAPELGPWDDPAPGKSGWGGALLDPVRDALRLTQEEGGEAND